MEPIIIERLTSGHVRDSFDCGYPALNIYIRPVASQHPKRGVGRTYVAVIQGDRTVLGYYTIAASRVEFEQWPENSKLPPNMPVPTLLLGKLAVDNRVKGQKLGKFLLQHAMWRSVQVANEIGAYALEVDALDETAAAFYSHHGFGVLKDNSRHFFMPMAEIQKLNLDFPKIP